MKRIKNLFLLIAFIGFVSSCAKKEEHFISDAKQRAEVEADFQEKMTQIPDVGLNNVLNDPTLSTKEKEALKFLYAYMPLSDITDHPTTFYHKNIRASYNAREEMPWGKSVPEREFNHFVIPVRINNENLDFARFVFYEELKEMYEVLEQIEEYFSCILHDINSLILILYLSYSFKDLTEGSASYSDLYHTVCEFIEDELDAAEKEAYLDTLTEQLEAAVEPIIDKANAIGREEYELMQKAGSFAGFSDDTKKVLMTEEFIRECFFGDLNDELFHFNIPEEIADKPEAAAAIAFEKKNIPDSERYTERLRRRSEQKEQQKKQMRKVWISISCVILALALIALIALLPKNNTSTEEEPEASPSISAVISEPTPSPEATVSEMPSETPVKTPLIEDAADLAITIFNPYTELEGLYTGKTVDGIPEGEGSYIVKDENDEIILSYEGAFSGGEMTGKGTLQVGNTVYTGHFEKCVITGEASMQQDGKLRYIGSFVQGKKNGTGRLYTGTRELIYEGSFKDDRIDETENARLERGRTFAKDCAKLTITTYNRAKKELETAIGNHIYVRGTVLLLDDEAEAEDIFVLYFNGDKNFPIAMRHTYSTAEEQTGNKKLIYCYAIIEGKTTVKINGKNVTLPLMELVCSSKDALS